MRVVQNCAALCIENAQKVISLVIGECRTPSPTPNHQDETGSNPTVTMGLIPWWYRVFYLHVASTVLMAATLQPKLCTPAVSESWSRAMEALRAHAHLSPFVSQCLATFETISSGMAATDPHHLNQPSSGSGGVGPPLGVEVGANVPRGQPDLGLPQFQDFPFHDIVLDTGESLFAMEDMSWVGGLGLPL